MFKFLNKKNPPTKTFVTVSLLLLFIFFLLSLYFLGSFVSSQKEESSSFQALDLEELDMSDDPYITYFGDNNEKNSPEITKYDPKYGAENPKLQIIYFGDYTCSYCLEQIDMIKEEINNREDKIQLIWKDFPEEEINTISWQAALAGRCAQSQNKFWEFLSIYSKQYPIFMAQSGLNTTELNDFMYGLAKSIDLNTKKFKACYNKQEHNDVLLNALYEAKSLGLPGVPYTYIGDKEILGEFNSSVLKDEINQALTNN